MLQLGLGNPGIHNRSHRSLSTCEKLTLGLGLKHVLPPPLQMDNDYTSAVADLQRQIRLRHMFLESPPRQPDFLRLPNPGFDPLKAPWQYEQYINLVRSRIFTNLQQSRIKHSFCPAAIRRAIRALRDDETIMIKPADKNLGTAIVDMQWYLTEARRQLCDPSVYKPVDNGTAAVRHAYAKLRQLLKYSGLLFEKLSKPSDSKHIRTQKRPTKLATYLLQNEKEARMSQFYLIVKLHKSPIRGRPIVSTCASVTAAAAKYVDKCLQPVMRKQRSYIQDSAQLLHCIETTHLPDDIILLTADVESLYPSICLVDAMTRIRDLLHNDPHWGDNNNTTLVLDLMYWVLHHNIFKFGDTTWVQLRGTAMGSPLAVVFANLYLACLEEELIDSLSVAPLIYKRFIDDIFTVVKGSTEDCEAIMLKFNNLSPTINLTYDMGEEVPFLDLVISKGTRFKATGRLDVCLHQKELNMYLYIAPTSSHPIHSFTGFIKSELNRFLRNTSDADKFVSFKRLFHYRLRKRGYKPGHLRQVFNSVNFEDRANIIDNLKTKFACALKSKPTSNANPPLIFKTLFEPRSKNLNIGRALDIPEYLKEDQFFMEIFEGHKPLVCWKTGRSLKDLLCPTTFNHKVKEKWNITN